MPATLLALPDELLTQIFSCIKVNLHGRETLTTSCRSLRALALVNSRLSAIACRLLFEDVAFCLKEGPHLPLHVLKFAQSCEDNPVVVRRIRKLHIFWTFPTPKNWAWDLWEAIGLAQNLKILRLESFHTHSDKDILPVIIEYLILRLRSLEVLVINISQLTLSPRLFWKICRSQSLRVFEIHSQIREVEAPFDTVTSSDYLSDAQLSQATTSTNLTDLVCSHSCFDTLVLQLVLSSSPGLIRLQIPCPLTEAPQRGLSAVPNQPPRYVEPDTFTRMLLQCAESLLELVLVSDHQEIPRDYIIDLSCLGQLQRLVLSIRLLCGINGLSRMTAGPSDRLPSGDWLQRLPSGLHMLEIQYDSYGIFWDPIELTDYMRDTELPHIQMCSAFGWHLFEPRLGLEIATPHRMDQLTETVERTTDCLEYLSTLKFVEVISRKHKRDSWDQLDIAKVYPEAFGYPELNLQLIVRVPSGYSPPLFTTLNATE